MTSFYVEVFANGQLIITHQVEASDALSAINLVENNYGAPPQVAYKTIHHEDGTVERVLVVTSWHGYSFMARRVNT